MKKNALKAIAVGCVTAALALCCMGLVACSGSSSSSGSSSDSGSSTSGEATDSSSEYTLITPGKLTIGSDLDFPPMESLDDSGNPTGFGVALMQAICDKLGLEMNYLDPQNFDSLLTQVNAGNTMDVAVSSITITDERAEMVNFSDSYYDSNLAIVTMKGAYTDKSELNDASITVAAQSGTSGEDWIKENLPNATLVTFTGPTDAVTALVAGQCDAVVYDDPVAETHVSTQFTDCEVLEVIATGEQYGIAVNKSNTKLLADINAALKELKDDGTYDKLSAEYLG